MKRLLITIFTVGVLLSIVTVLVGTTRYGSFSAFSRRIQVEIDGFRPKEPIVIPTFVPEEEVSAADFVAQVKAEEPLGSPTPTTIKSLPTSTAAVEAEVLVEVTPTASPSPIATILPTPSPTPIYVPFVPYVNLTGYRHHWQTWNNCGPATIATYLSFLNKQVTQEDTASILKPNENDKNVRVEEIIAYVESRFPDLFVTSILNGSADDLKILLSNGIPVMVQTWLEEDPDDGMGHYRFVVGFDESSAEWIVSDSYVSTGVESPYAGIRIGNQKFMDHWFVFDNIFILVYEAEQEAIVQAILGEDLDQATNHANALAYYTDLLEKEGNNAFVWHTMGDLLLEDGRPEQAAKAYDQARAIGLPWRMFWYNFGAFEAYAAVGRYEDVVELADITIESGGPGEEIYYWKGVAHRALGEEQEAQRSFDKGLWWNPTHLPTQELLRGTN